MSDNWPMLLSLITLLSSTRILILGVSARRGVKDSAITISLGQPTNLCGIAMSCAGSVGQAQQRSEERKSPITTQQTIPVLSTGCQGYSDRHSAADQALPCWARNPGRFE